MIYLFLAEGFEEVEALTPLDFIRRAGLQIQTVGLSSKCVTGAHNIQVLTDCLPEEVQEDDIQMLILPGGMPGTRYLKESIQLQEMLQRAVKQKVPIASICAAPSVLGEKGYLQGMTATCYPGFEESLFGATFVDKKVVVDLPFITARGAGCAMEFAFAIIKTLISEDKAKEIAEQVCY